MTTSKNDAAWMEIKSGIENLRIEEQIHALRNSLARDWYARLATNEARNDGNNY